MALGRQVRRPHGQRRRLGRPGAARPPSAPASACGTSRCPRSTARNLDSEIADLRNIVVGRRRRNADRRAVPARSSPATRRGSTSTSRAPARVVGRRRRDVEGRHRLRRAHARRARVELPQAGPMNRRVSRSVRASCSSSWRSLGVAACGSSSAKSTPAAPTNLQGKAQFDIDAKSYQFTPNDVVVDVGTKVTWHNTDSVAHNVKKSADALTSAHRSARPTRSTRAELLVHLHQGGHVSLHVHDPRGHVGKSKSSRRGRRRPGPGPSRPGPERRRRPAEGRVRQCAGLGAVGEDGVRHAEVVVLGDDDLRAFTARRARRGRAAP